MDFYYPQVESQLLTKSRALEQLRIRTGQVKEAWDKQARLDAPNLALPETPVTAGDIVEAVNRFNRETIQRADITNKLLESGFVKEGAANKLVEVYEK